MIDGWLALPFGLSMQSAVLVGAVLFGAAWVRGFSGFGFAALAVMGSGLFMDPRGVVPVVILADVALTAVQARGLRGQVDWRRAGALFAGCLPGVPLGLWMLSGIGADAARAVVSAWVLVMCAVLLAGWRLARPPGTAAHFGVGIVSGAANAAAVGGLPVAAFFAAQPMQAVRFRATLIVYFTMLDLWTLPLMAGVGMVTPDTLRATVLAMPLMVLGVILGGRRFTRAAPEGFRRFSIGLLAVLAVAGLAKAGWNLA